MPTRRRFLQTTAAATASLPLAPAFAYAAPSRDAWIELFDGQTLKGWHKNPTRIGHGDGGRWQVEEGTITGEQDPPGSGNGGILLTDRKFGDFELLIDLKPDWGICSGLFLRGNDKGQCLQMMVDYHDAGNVGQLYGEGLGGFNTRTFDVNGKLEGEKLAAFTTDKHHTAAEVGLVSACTPEEWIKAWKIDDWNTARVIVSGKYAHITTYLNDQQVCVFDGSTSTAAKYDKDKVVEQLGAEGSIAVQVHGGKNWPSGAKCRWKNIKIKPA
ncbi:MAG TPA: DUF1080 domain-containing protein [Pirellulaceae bacterium]|nr:DUF1080 domain-containing protein [Pirellulaceae bacterium]